MKRRGGLLAFAIAALLTFAPAAAATTYKVKNSGDPALASCTSSHCTLRDAITAANNHVGTDRIEIHIGSGAQTITPTSQLPDITEAVTLTGWTQPGWSSAPIIGILGTSAGSSSVGLKVMANDVKVQGFVIKNFGNHGIQVGDGGPTINNTTIRGDRIGVNTSGTQARPNGAGGGPPGEGIHLYKSVGTVIGGVVSGGTVASKYKNVVSGNAGHGIHFDELSNGAILRKNRVGTNSAGSAAIANQGNGILIDNGSGALQIGDDVSGATNVVSGNALDGIKQQSDIAGNTTSTFLRNKIGTNKDGNADLGNAGTGLHLISPLNDQIGGPDPDQRNVISGNNGDGISLEQEICSPCASNVQIQGNYVGVKATGGGDLGNGLAGVRVTDTTGGDSIGGDTTAKGNVISGNGWGVIVQDEQGIEIRKDKIGVSASGGSVPNENEGVLVSGNSGNVFVTDTLVANNLTDGVEVAGNSTVDVLNTELRNNGGSGFYINGGSGRFGISNPSTSHNNGGDGITVTGSSGFLVMENGNSIYDNANLAIDFNDDGVTANDTLDPDTGPNFLQNWPDITSYSAGVAQVHLNSAYNFGQQIYFVRVYSNGTTCDPSGNGEAKTELGTSPSFAVDMTTGDGSTAVTLNPAPAPGTKLTAIAFVIDANNIPSEVGTCFTVL